MKNIYYSVDEEVLEAALNSAFIAGRDFSGRTNTSLDWPVQKKSIDEILGRLSQYKQQEEAGYDR